MARSTKHAQRLVHPARVTIQDVAKEAGVAVSTVSRVLNQTDYTSETTRARVLEAAGRLNYTAHPSARGLRQARTMTIGMLLTDLTNSIYIEFIRGAQEVAADHGYELLIGDGRNSAAVQSRLMKNFYDRRVDALVMRGPLQATEELRPFIAARIPIYPNARLQGQRVVVRDPREEDEASYRAFSELVDMGHRSIAFISRARSGHMLERFGTLERVLKDRGIPAACGQSLLATNLEEARDTLRQARFGPDPVTAIISGTHVLTPLLLTAMREMGLKMPADVSFVTYGDSVWAAAYDPPISAIRMDDLMAGRMAVETVLDVLSGKLSETPETHVAAEYIRRSSCGPPFASME